MVCSESMPPRCSHWQMHRSGRARMECDGMMAQGGLYSITSAWALTGAIGCAEIAQAFQRAGPTFRTCRPILYTTQALHQSAFPEPQVPTTRAACAPRRAGDKRQNNTKVVTESNGHRIDGRRLQKALQQAVIRYVAAIGGWLTASDHNGTRTKPEVQIRFQRGTPTKAANKTMTGSATSWSEMTWSELTWPAQKICLLAVLTGRCMDWAERT